MGVDGSRDAAVTGASLLGCVEALQQPVQTNAALPTLVQLEIGKNKEGYWDGSNQAEQAKKVQKVMMILFPDYEIWHVYDW